MDEKDHPYNHAEAFCHMKYRCKVGHEFTIWNSRDGVTPFMVSCPEMVAKSDKRLASFVGKRCAAEAQHYDWRSDKREPDYVPQWGDLVWIDMPKEVAKIHALMRLRQMEDTEYRTPRGTKQWDETLASLIEDFTRMGSPYLLRT